MKINNIIIFGAGKYGRQLKKMIEGGKIPELENYCVKYFCDNNRLVGKYVEDIEILHPEELQQKEPYDIVISAPGIVDAVMLQLKNLNIENKVYYTPEYSYKLLWNDKMPFLIEMDVNKPRMPYLECEVTTQCNLYCNGCSVGTNISPKWFLTPEQLEKDCKQLRKLYSGIRYFKLYGGEPLLNEQLIELLEVARTYFPDAEQLVVHSNGLNVPDVDEALLMTMSKLGAEFDFTLYPETGKKKRHIEQRLKRYGIPYVFRDPTYEFRKIVNPKGDYDPNATYSNCRKAINLIDGTLSCGLGYLIDKIEKKFDTTICECKFQNCIDIYNTDLDGWGINKKLDSACDLCRYCAFMKFDVMNGDEYFSEWRNNCPPQLTDWLI